MALKKPIRLKANPDNTVADKLKQQVLKLTNPDLREATLLALVQEKYKDQTLIFFKTKKHCHRMAILFGLLGLSVSELHGDLSQHQRIEAFENFKVGKYQFLMATDLASRGLDIRTLKAVINFELP
jgi:ATP-dependent RNA helicase DDX27